MSWTALHGAMGYGKITLVDDTKAVQTAQVRLSSVETKDAMPVPKHFGFESHPPADSDAVFIALGGDRSKAVVIGTNHQPSRMKGLPEGGSRHHDQGGRQLLIDNGGLIQLFGPGETLHRLMTEIAQQVFNQHTHVCHGNGVSTSAPEQQMGDAHLTTATRAGT